MVRSILLGLLVFSSASACKGGGSDAPAVEPGRSVGKVVEVAGKVTATRGTQTRDLDASSAVSGDDVITTAADGRVTILLEHNNAKWDLGPNKHEQVSTSMAWQLAKVDAPAGTVDETTTAAGRHAERAAANGESAAAPAAATARGGAAASEPAPAPPTPAEAPKSSTGAQPARRPRAIPPAKTTVAPPSSDVGAAANDGAPPSPNRRSAAQIVSPKASEAMTATDEGGGRNPLQAAVDKERAALEACVVASGKPSLAIKVHVANGKATIELTDGSAADTACVAKVAARIKLTVDVADYATIIAR